MKKIVLIVITTVLALNVFSQIEKGKIIFSVDGNYMKSTKENGVISNQNVVQGKYLNIGASVGYFLTDKFVMGVGCDYNWEKEDRKNVSLIDSGIQIEVMNLKSKAFLPYIYMENYYQIFNKFYFNTKLKLSHGKIKSEYTNVIVSGSKNRYGLEIIDQSKPYNSIPEKSSEIDFVSAKLSPELTYFISSNFGLSLGLGGIEYSMVDGNTDNSNWIINFNPINWRLGAKIKI